MRGREEDAIMPTTSDVAEPVVTRFDASALVDETLNEQTAAEPETDTDPLPQDGADVETSETPSPVEPAPTDADTPPAEDVQAEPFTYTVDGQARSDPAAYRIPGDGLYIPEREVPRYQQMAARAELGERQSRDLYDQSRRLSEAMQWQVPGPDGQPKTLAGLEGLGEMRALLAQTLAANQAVDAFLSDPGRLGLLFGADQQGNLAVNPAGMQQLRLAVENAQLRASQAARTEWGRRTAGVRESAPSATVSAAPTMAQAQAQAPALLTAVLQATSLTASPEQQQYLATQIPYYLRPAEAGERDSAGQFLQAGEPVLDPAFVHLAQRELARTAPATTTAAKFNAGQQRGRQAATAPARRAGATTPASPTGTAPRVKFDAVIQNVMNDPDILALMGDG